MARHLTQSELERYTRGDAAPAELLAFDDHIASCQECRSRMPVRPGLANWVTGLSEGQPVPPAATTPAVRPKRWRWTAAVAAAAAIILGFWGLRHPVATPDVAATPVAPVPQAAAWPAGWSDAERALVERTLASGVLPVSSPEPGLDAKPLTLLGPAATSGFAPLEPLNRTVFDDRPEFRWQPLAGASAYHVEVFDAQFHVIAKGQDSAQTTWRPTSPLPRGTLLLWQVVAARNGESVSAPAPPAPEARLRILDAATALRIERARNDGPAGRLLSAILFAQHGMRAEALTELSAASPREQDRPAVENLIRSLGK